MDPSELPEIRFGTPRKLPKPATLNGRVAVLDIAFSADQMGSPWDKVTGAFLAALGDWLAIRLDHHDHDRHAEYRDDPRFVLATKAEHGGCPEMITPEIVARTGKVETILCHLDLDGLYCAAKWCLGGREPYPGADLDARAVDTRLGTPGLEAERIDRAIRGRPQDDGLRQSVVRYLVGGLTDANLRAEIGLAAGQLEDIENTTRHLAEHYRVEGKAAIVELPPSPPRYDKTLLLLLGQKLAPVSIVRDCGTVTVAAAFDSGYDFIQLLGIEGGMPTRVSIRGQASSRAPEGHQLVSRTDEMAAQLAQLLTTSNRDELAEVVARWKGTGVTRAEREAMEKMSEQIPHAQEGPRPRTAEAHAGGARAGAAPHAEARGRRRRGRPRGSCRDGRRGTARRPRRRGSGGLGNGFVAPPRTTRPPCYACGACAPQRSPSARESSI